MSSIRKDKSGQLQARCAHRNGWTLERRTRFLAMLACTCNVQRSAQYAGKSANTARDLRHRDPEFGRLWDEAIARGTEFLQEQLLARALGTASSGDNPEALPEEALDAAEQASHERFDPDLALKLLQVNAGRRPLPGRGRVREATQGELDVALLERLDKLAASRGNDR
jgi:hypothetical protein